MGRKMVSHLVDKNFQNWVLGKQAGALKFSEKQINWLRMLKDHIIISFHVEIDDLDYTPFDAQGAEAECISFLEME